LDGGSIPPISTANKNAPFLGAFLFAFVEGIEQTEARVWETIKG